MALTPMMQQYVNIKEQYKDAILLFRLGDFYEMFFEDAVIASRELELTLTGKDCGLEERAPMCGVPFHAVEPYIAKLIDKGYKVAIGEQVEDPKMAKGIVKREITRVVTPGTVTENTMLQDDKNNYIVAIYKLSNEYGLAVSDISTGEFSATQFNEENNFIRLIDELARIKPKEIVVNDLLMKDEKAISILKARFNAFISLEQDYSRENSREAIKDIQTNVDMENRPLAQIACGALLSYLEDTQKVSLNHINKIEFYNSSEYMVLDISTRRNLEISETMRERAKRGTLLWVLDKTNTSMGARLLRQWIERPLINQLTLQNRIDAVDEFKSNSILRAELIEHLKKIYDIERLLSKMVYGNANARDMLALKCSLYQIPDLQSLLKSVDSDMLQSLQLGLDELNDVADLIEKSIAEDVPITIKEGGIIKEGYNEEVDKLRYAKTNAKEFLARLENEEREKTGIKTLKVGFNKVFGYYIEVTKSNYSLVPDNYVRKQTLANCERYITQELKEMEDSILGAEEKLVDLEYNLFVQVREYVANQIERIQKTASIIANLDVLSSLAEVAQINNYVKPEYNKEGKIEIREGRHPVVERTLNDIEFVPNDTVLDLADDNINIITGPNMAGKSTYMRQVALIVLMAQIGSFVPAEYANIGIVDRIFTRVGASDDLAMGQSTFMVEMSEVAGILNNATQNSLVILDEIGRGTSTFDGLSIAWAVVEHISEKIKARTLFATHYHELTDLEGKLEGVKNYCISVKEKGEDIIFLRKIIRGGADGSYGIHVAKLAGVPYAVVNRAKAILKNLDETNVSKRNTVKVTKNTPPVGQFDMFNYKLGALAEELDKINLDGVTPLDALNILYKLKDKIN